MSSKRVSARRIGEMKGGVGSLDILTANHVFGGALKFRERTRE